MTIQVEFEDFAVTEQQRFVIETAVTVANERHNEIHSALDHARTLLSMAGYWVYRGGYHLGIHFMQADGSPHESRSALIR